MTHDDSELRRWIVSWLASELQLGPEEIAAGENLLVYGVDSVNAMMLVGDLEDHLGLRLAPTLVWDYPTIDGLVARLGTELNEQRRRDAASPDSTTGHRRGIDDMEIAEAKQLLEKLDQLSDAEVDALLKRLAKEK